LIDGQLRLEFAGLAQGLTRRAKAEIAVVTRTAYRTERQRLNRGVLLPTQTIDTDGRLDMERELQP
jgi:hypothetical protein